MFVEVNNIRLHIKIFGEKHNPAVVLSHSLGSDMSTWDLLVPELKKDYHVICMDMRGHGLSTTDTDFTFKDLAADVIAILDKLNIAKAHFIGLSIGGMIAQSLGIHYGDRLLSLTIMASMSSVGENKQMWEDRISEIPKTGLEPLVQATLERWFTSSTFKDTPELIAKVGKLIPGTSLEGYTQACKAISQLDLTDKLKSISTPTQIIVGAQDKGTPPALSEIINKEISGSKLHVVENAAHQVALERSEIVNRLVLEFLKNV